ncbi:MAG: glycosyltransferase family 4 protein [Bacteroidia bacterium]
MANADSLNILMLCTKFPYPPKDGGTMAMHSMIRGFSKAGHQVTVLTMNTSKHYVLLRALPEEIQRMANFYAVDVDTDVSFLDALSNLIFSRESYHVVRFTSGAFNSQLERLLEKNEYDVIQLETLFMTPYIKTIRSMQPKALISLRTHNIEHEIWSRRANNENNPVKEYYFRETAARIKTFEETTYGGNPFDVVVPITGKDAGTLKNMGVKTPVMVSQAGIDEEDLDTSPVKPLSKSIFYIGSLDWGPNIEGLDWFLRQVWPRFTKMHPDVKFYIAGRNMPSRYLKLDQNNIIVAGEVENSGKFIRTHSIMVVPILSGSGMRVKIAEGLAYGKAIVATRIAAEGISVKHGYDILLADTPEDFCNSLSILVEKESMLSTISYHAKGLWMRELKNDKIIASLADFYRKEVAKKAK